MGGVKDGTPSPPKKARFQFRYWHLLIFVVVASIIVFIALGLGTRFLNMKSEYVTAGVIRNTNAFVEDTGGQWPRSWTDLKMDDMSAYTRMNFDIDPTTATKEEIMSSIRPQSDMYITYPNAEDDLERLWTELQRHSCSKQVTTKSATPPPSAPPVEKMTVEGHPKPVQVDHDSIPTPKTRLPKDNFFWITGGIRIALTPLAKARLKRVITGPALSVKSERHMLSLGKPVGGFTIDGRHFCFLFGQLWPDGVPDFERFWRDEIFDRLTKLIGPGERDHGLAQLALLMLEQDERQKRKSDSTAAEAGKTTK